MRGNRFGKKIHINPVYKKELKQSARMPRTAIILLVYNSLMLLFGLFAFYVTFEGGGRYGSGIDYSDILSIYAIMTGIEFTLILLITPMLTAGTIAGEREKQTLDILLTTKLSTFQLISGKLASSLSLILLLMMSSLPILAIVFSVGGVTLTDLMQFMLLLFVTSIYIGSIGIFFSVLCRKTTAATVCSYMALFVLLFGTIAAAGAVGIMKSLNSEVYHGIMSLYTYYRVKIGPFAFILLINPLLTFAAMIYDQVGEAAMVMGCLEQAGKAGTFIVRHWFPVSMLLQAGIAAGLLAASQALLKSGGKKERIAVRGKRTQNTEKKARQ